MTENKNIVLESIDFIEENLFDSLSLELLSKNTYLSKYHFHRVFLSSIGNSVMRFIRERRIIRSTHLLIYSNETITSISFEHGFKSLDTYIRAFKKMYGITPSEYREVIKPLTSKNYTRRENVDMLDWDLGKRLKCSFEEKQEVIALLGQVLDLSKAAHRKGLLELENCLDLVASKYLKKGLKLLLFGIEPPMLRHILEDYILAGDYKGKELLEHIIIMEGLLLIQSGEYPWVIREKLSAFFGEEFIDEIESRFGAATNLNKRLTDFLASIKDKTLYSSETKLLEADIKKMSSRSLQRLLREVDIMVLAIGMKGSSGKIQSKIVNHLSSMSKIILFEILDLINDLSISQIIDAQNKILEISKQLRVEGEIL